MSDQFTGHNRRQDIIGRIAKLKSEVKELWADCEELKQERDEAIQRAERVEGALKQLEWWGYRTSDLRQCPVCFGLKREGVHDKKCFIAIALQPTAQESSKEKEINHA